MCREDVRGEAATADSRRLSHCRRGCSGHVDDSVRLADSFLESNAKRSIFEMVAGSGE